jgi:hypothetical protein
MEAENGFKTLISTVAEEWRSSPERKKGDFLSTNVPEGPSADEIEASGPVFKKEEREMVGWIFRMLLVFGSGLGFPCKGFWNRWHA